MAFSIAVIGNSGLNIGAAMAGDLALAGHDVRLQLWADQLECLEAVGSSPFYENIGELPADIWRTWLSADVPLAHVPFVLLAESVGLSVPLHRGFVNLVDALLGTTSWQDGLTRERLGLAGMDPARIAHYAETGEPGYEMA